MKIDFNDLFTQPRWFFCPRSNSNCIYLAYKSHRESYTYAGFGMRERNAARLDTSENLNENTTRIIDAIQDFLALLSHDRVSISSRKKFQSSNLIYMHVLPPPLDSTPQKTYSYRVFHLSPVRIHSPIQRINERSRWRVYRLHDQHQIPCLTNVNEISSSNNWMFCLQRGFKFLLYF